jgi:hypothetical protein
MLEEQEAKSGIDTSKKRESSGGGDDAPGVDNPEERTKRFRLRQQFKSLETDDLKPEEAINQLPIIEIPTKRDPTNWDLETAMHRLVNESDTPKEFLSENASVSFRVGNAEDAPVIATWYREMEDAKKGKSAGVAANDDIIGENGKNDSLELWLQEGFGDERTPPCIFALLADVHVKNEPDSRPPLCELSDSDRVVEETVTLGACALFTLAWEHSQRLLRVEWFHVDPTMVDGEVLGRRLWLRLSTLALMTACQVMVVDSAKVTNFRSADES